MGRHDDPDEGERTVVQHGAVALAVTGISSHPPDPGLDAFEPVSFAIAWGSLTALVPRGAGSSVLRCLAGEQSVDDGMIRLDASMRTPQATSVAMVVLDGGAHGVGSDSVDRWRSLVRSAFADDAQLVGLANPFAHLSGGDTDLLMRDLRDVVDMEGRTIIVGAEQGQIDPYRGLFDDVVRVRSA